MAGMVSSIIEGVLSGLNTKVGCLEEENRQLKHKIETLELRQDRADQYSRRNCLRLTGMQEISGESADAIIMKMATDIGADISLEEIDRAHRLPKPKQNSAGQSKPRDIVVKLTSYRSRQKFLSKKSLLKDKGYRGVFINEHLTATRDQLFYQARKMVKDKQVLCAWTKDGTILIKDSRAKIHRVECQCDLDKVKASITAP